MLKKLELSDFRNYADLRLEFAQPTGLTYMIGDNGQGKTNVLEAIYMLALGKSFRSSDEADLIRWDTEFGRIKGNFEGESGFVDGSGAAAIAELEIFLGKPPQPKRVFKVNRVKSSAVNFVGRTRVVFFHPEDLNVLYLGPDLRRRYLDLMILQKSRPYFAALRAYKRIRAQRNALLGAIKERRAAERDLEVWDEQLVREGALIWKMRGEALSYIDRLLTEKYMEISGRAAELKVAFKNSLGFNYELMSMTENLEELFKEELAEARPRELASEHTLIGPHRDDLEFYLNGRPILQHASRGEFRTILLALKLIEMDYFNSDGIRPILLLDDVFSELDHERQRFLLEKVIHYQTFITTTKDSVIINRENLIPGNFIEIKRGKALF
jgi:DNA replication and repair protein RecF